MPGPISRLPTSGTAVRRLLIAAMVIGFASLIAAGIAAAWVTSRNQQHSAAVVHTYQVEQAIAVYRVLIEQAETARRGYIVDQRPSFLNSYQIAAAALPAALDRIAALTADNPHEIERVRRLRALTTQLGALRERTNDLVGSGRMADAVTAFREDASVPTMRNVRAIGEQMIREERGLLASRDAVQKASVRLFFVILSIAGVLLVLVAVTTLVTVLRYTRDLQASRDALRDLADSLEEAVQERTADLTRANEEIQRFAYIVSHDLRSPLVNVMGFTAELDAATKAVAELIDRAEQEAPDLVTEEARLAAREDLPEAIGFIRSSTEKMDRLINAILKLSREGRRVLAPERLDLDALLDGIRDTLQHRIDEEEIALIVRHPLPEIASDRVAIEQIFSNLIENAVKYLQPGRKGRIEVRGERQGNRVSFEIEDNGRGIDPRDHARVFDLFRRSGTQDQPGEGIGLAHVRALAYRLGGIIDVSSELGKGATFRLSLPASFTPIQERITMNDQRPVTIVMIEDDEGHARLIEKNIRRAGISNAIEHFTDGTTALHYLYNDQNGPALNGPALILLDLNLPDMSGTDILAKIKSEGPLKRTPVVVLTTTDDKVEIQRCYDLGCNVYITKPVNYESFAQAIRQLGLFLSVIQVPEVEAG